MDIRNWGINKIMQLPDSMLGRRFCVSCAITATQGALVWDISEVALPERTVLWNVGVWSGVAGFYSEYFRMALGDQLPTAAAMMNALEPLVPGLGLQGAGPRQIPLYMANYNVLSNLKHYIPAMGRRFVLEVKAVDTKAIELVVVLTVSSIPNEVPDCLLSG